MISFAKRYPYMPLLLLCVSLLSAYWGLIASDRFVSQANVVLESPQLAPPSLNFQSLLSGSGGSHGDMLLLRDHLLSVDMLRKIDAALDIRSHFSATDIDWLSRLPPTELTIEDFHTFYLKRIHVDLDDYAGVLRINVEAHDPQMAQQIAEVLLQEGERHMNTMGQRLAEEQVRFLERQVDNLSQRFNAARQDLLDYQNANGLVSPTGTIESLGAVVAGLESELTNLRAKRSVLSSYQSPDSPEVIRIDAEIKALIEQIAQEKGRMAQRSGGALNTVSSEYQRLELKAQFAQDSYSGALAALENTRIEAARKLKQVSILQSPTLPEYPIKPQRIYNIGVIIIFAFFLGLILHMMLLIIKDHRD